jgi:hypothetical protein
LTSRQHGERRQLERVMRAECQQLDARSAAGGSMVGPGPSGRAV